MKMTIVVMGVAGSGKTTVGRQLAAALGCRFADADDFHSPASIDKMRRGIGLTSEDRQPWLERLRNEIIDATPDGQTVVLACSALQERDRRLLTHGRDDVRFVYLRATPALVRDRLAQRHGHFAGEALVGSQFRALEEPHDAIVVDASAPISSIVAAVMRDLR